MGIGASAFIAIVVASIFVNYYTLNNLQFRGNTAESIDFATLSMDMKIDACNPTPIPTRFDKFTIAVNYRGEEFATMMINGKTIPPYQTTILDGRMSVNGEAFAGLFMKTLADGLAGRQGQSFEQEEDMTVVTTIDSRALGFIPISDRKSLAMSEFQQQMQQDDEDQFSCA